MGNYIYVNTLRVLKRHYADNMITITNTTSAATATTNNIKAFSVKKKHKTLEKSGK